MEIYRVLLNWSGFLGAPGYSAFHFAGGGGLISDAQQVAQRVMDGAGQLIRTLPDSVRLEVDSEVQRIDSATGEIIGFQEIAPIGAVVGLVDGGYSAASGAVINWRTNDVRFGRRIRGRTFCVPLAGRSYEDDGTLTTDARGIVQDFASEIAGTDFDSELGVWSRPRDGAGGVFASVTSFSVPDMAAVLRSRRD